MGVLHKSEKARMAAKRISKSAVDWAAIAQRVPASQGDAYRAFRMSSEKYLNRITELPESLPKISFEEYRNRVSNKAMVAEFEKLYAAMQIAYPKDTSGALNKINTEEKAALEHAKTVEAGKKVDIQHFQQLKDAIKLVPGPDQMTKQMYAHYFPEYARNPNKENPGTIPDLPEFQLENIHLTGNQFYNYQNDRRNLKTCDEFDAESWEAVAAEEKAAAEKK